jgi:hypothetical protein
MLITIIRVDTIVVPDVNVGKRGVVTEFIINLGHGSSGFLVRRNLSRTLGLPMANIGVIRTPQMVFINRIMIIHVHKTIDRPPMSSIAI